MFTPYSGYFGHITKTESGVKKTLLAQKTRKDCKHALAWNTVNKLSEFIDSAWKEVYLDKRGDLETSRQPKHGNLGSGK